MVERNGRLSVLETCDDEYIDQPRQGLADSHPISYTTMATLINERSRSPKNARIISGAINQEVEFTNLRKIITEEDLNELRRSMNSALVECMKETEHHKQQCKMYEERFLKCSAKVVELQNELDIATKERDHFKRLSEEYFKKMNQQKDEFIELEAAKISQIKTREINLTTFEQLLNTIGDETTRESLKQQFEGIKGTLMTYQESFCDVDYLVQENKRMREQIEAIEEGKNTLRHCMNCKDKYSPLQNDDNACHYHSGRLKYYSCRGCGADEYYSCCNRCKKCSKGCKKGRHAGN